MKHVVILGAGFAGLELGLIALAATAAGAALLDRTVFAGRS
jgi:NADH dehydrogenase FAD-containing subunit